MYPENTMLAFSKAKESGCNAIELDVHFSKDGQLVIIHDETVDRTTDSKGFVRDFSLNELMHMNAGEGQGLPNFDEYCKFAKKEDIVTNVEIKTDRYYYDGIEEAVLNMLSKYNLIDQSIISSFNHSSILLTKRLNPSIQCGFLVGSRGIGNVGAYCEKFGIEYYHPDGSTLTKQDVDSCHAHGVGVNVWTVNTLDVYQNLKQWNADGIITNYCDSMLRLEI